MGAALADRPRDDVVLSTKVGRLGPRRRGDPAGADIDRQALDGREDAYLRPTRQAARIVFDYSADGVRRSLEESLERLGLDRIDIALHPRPGRPLARGHRRGVAGTGTAPRRRA